MPPPNKKTPPSGDGSTKNNGEPSESYNKRNALKVIMDYYKNNEKFSGSVDDDWNRHLKRFEDLCLEYPTDKNTQLIHFSHSLVDTSQAYHYYTSLVEGGTTWISLVNAFRERYHSFSRRTRFSRQLKSISFKKYRLEESTDDKAFMKMLSEIDRIDCLVHPEDRTPHALSSILWQAVLGQPWALVAQTKDGMSMNYSKAVDSLSDALQDYSDYQSCSQPETPILYEDKGVMAEK